jgi:hypothetical protein
MTRFWCISGFGRFGDYVRRVTGSLNCSGIALNLSQRLFDYLTEVTSFARIDDYLVHKASPCRTIVPLN